MQSQYSTTFIRAYSAFCSQIHAKHLLICFNQLKRLWTYLSISSWI